MNLVRLEDPTDARLDDYRAVRERDLVTRRGVFIAEGRLVVRTLLTQSRFAARSVLVNDAALPAVADAVPDELPVYLVPQNVLDSVTGFHIHRGCLAVGERAGIPSLDGLLGSIPADAAASLVALESLSNHDNVGGVFRNALAFGASGVVLSPGCADPHYRKAIRVSMGAALRVPFAHAEPWADSLARLNRAGFTVVALTPAPDAVDISDVHRALSRPRRVALLLGTEGAGLSADALAASDLRVRIPMAPGVDSLNVASAAAVALHRLAHDAR